MADIDTNTAIIIAAISSISAIIGASIGAVANYLIEKQRSRKEEKEHQREIEAQFLTDRRAAYHKFIQVFSTKFSGSSEEYLNAALEAAHFGKVILPRPIKMEEEQINSLDSLIKVLIRLRTEKRYNPVSYPNDKDYDDDGTYVGIMPDYIYDEFGDKFDKLRAEAALEFSPLLIEILLRKPE